MMDTKICSKCKIEKSKDNYKLRMLRGKLTLRSRCRECEKEDWTEFNNRESTKESRKKWYIDNLDVIKQKQSEWYYDNLDIRREWINNNPDKIAQYRINSKETDRIWREKNKEYLKLKYKEWYNSNSKRKDYLKKYRNEKINNDEIFKLSISIRGTIYKSIIRKGYTKKSKTYEILGCTFEEFKKHIESQFEPWMNWDNYGNKNYTGEFNQTWQYDHIVPISSATTEEEVIMLNHYTNLQPLCSRINMYVKKDKLDYSIENIV